MLGAASVPRRTAKNLHRVYYVQRDDGPWTFDLAPLVAGDYVYVRAMQTDRGTAWSSPFFVKE